VNFDARFDCARAVADTVLFEGYSLYPYRPNATKNQLRWQFGVLVPRAASEATRTDPWWMETQCLMTSDAARVEGKLRFLRIRRRTVESMAGEELPLLEVDGQLLVSWDEGELCEIDVTHALDSAASERRIALDGNQMSETIRDAQGREVARVRRSRAPLELRIAVESSALGAGLLKLRARCENVSACAAPAAPRHDTIRWATLGTHLLLAVEAGEFVSLLDPPAAAVGAAEQCRNVGTYPVLVGEPGRRNLMLSSPIILYDHPAIAPESPGDLFDATEIDEILTLRTLLLTEEEKRLARATDSRVKAVVDRAESLGDESWARLHGAFRPTDVIRIGESEVTVGSRVRLRPGTRRTDAQDLFLEGRTATIHEVKRDVDGRFCLAVTVDGDPAVELNVWHGRYRYFYVDEVEPLHDD
jgi:hypothetical protein